MILLINVIEQYHPKLQHFFPKYESMKNRISILRKRSDIKPVSNNNVPEIIKNTATGEFFYLFDSGENDEKRVLVLLLLIFCTLKILKSKYVMGLYEVGQQVFFSDLYSYRNY
ncbi:hypothetical protein DMUE_1601 [Dictyocoela muelleri]|nr:hypothetical protein DMUE_1601 [Dictyocoela muelleri]